MARYPANTARNVARLHSSSEFILIADYEHLFNEGFEQKVLEIAKIRLNQKRVLVYRIFEISETATEPRNKEELKKLYDAGDAVVFHAKYYQGAHAIPKLDEWFAENSPSSGIFAENVKYERHDWEPQFVSKSDIPLHDVHFPFLIRDNTVLRWELCRAGYQFDVLSDYFMYHRGIKTKDSLGISKPIQQINSKKFSGAIVHFNKRMDEEHPDTTSKCPRFGA